MKRKTNKQKIYRGNVTFSRTMCLHAQSLNCIWLFTAPQSTRLPCPWNFQARILEWVAISYSRGDNIQPWHTPFPIWKTVCCSMSSSNCCFLTCIQVSQKAGQAVWYSHLFQNFPQFIVIHTVEGSRVVNKAEIDVFLELSCFFDDPADIGNLILRSSAFSKTSLKIWKFSVHVLLKPGLENFEHYFTGVWDECNCAVVWAFFGIAFLRDWNENWPFPVL